MTAVVPGSVWPWFYYRGVLQTGGSISYKGSVYRLLSPTYKGVIAGYRFSASPEEVGTFGWGLKVSWCSFQWLLQCLLLLCISARQMLCSALCRYKGWRQPCPDKRAYSPGLAMQRMCTYLCLCFQNGAILNKGTGRCLEVENRGMSGIDLILRSCTGQRWTIKNFIK